LERRLLLAAGTFDPTFGTAGVRTVDWSLPDSAVNGMAVQPGNNILVVGSSRVGRLFQGDSRSDFYVVRLDDDGTADADFGNNGLVTTDFAGAEDDALAVAVQPDGKIVVVGQAAIQGQNDFAVASYNSDGSLDSCFGAGGKVTVDFNQKSDFATSVAIAADGSGKIVVAGGATVAGSLPYFGLIRLNADGTLDSSFGTGGKLTTDFGFGFSRAQSVAILPSGAIVAAGIAETTDFSASDFAVARFLASGALDPSWSGDGRATAGFQQESGSAYGMAVRPDGRVGT
jgi:uncharacterized delta-60 repeat protein